MTIFYSWIFPADIVLLNGITALLSAVGAAALIETIRKLGGHGHVISGLAFSAVPVIYINSINTMDYLWALSLLLMAVLFFSFGKVLVAAVLIGVACGARFEYAAMLLPFSFLIVCSYRQNQKWWKLLWFWGVSLGSMALVFIPVLKKYGTKLFFSKWKLGDKMDFDLLLLLNNGTVKTWGSLGVLAVLTATCALIVHLSFRRNRTAKLGIFDETRSWHIFCLMTIVGYSYAFVRLPLESGYLIPIVAFIFLFFSLSLPKRIVQIYSIFIVLSPFLLSAYFSSKPNPEAIFSADTGIDQKSKAIHLNIESVGPIIKAKEEREALAIRVRHAISTVSSLTIDSNNEPTAFVVGSLQPTLDSLWDDAWGNNVRFYYAISGKTMRDLKKRNVRVYVSPLGEYYSKKEHKFNVLKNGGKRITF